MKIHFKALLLFAVAMLLLFSVVFLLSTEVTLGAFRELESNGMRQRADRFVLTLSDRMRPLTAAVGDWASWDELYNFVETRSPDFADANISAAGFKNLGLSFLIIVDNKGGLVDGWQLDPIRGNLIPVAPADVARLGEMGYFPQTDPNRHSAGQMLLNSRVCSIAAFPILTSRREGPVRGTIIGGTYFGLEEIDRVERAAEFQLQLLPLTGERDGEDWDSIREILLTSGGPAVAVIDDQSIAAYLIERDLQGRPAFIAKLTSARTIYVVGERMIRVFLVAFAICAGVLFLFVFFGLDRTVLSPIRKLQRGVEAAGSFSSPPFRLKLPGGDEIALLSGKIEEMATSLAETQKRYRAVVESQVDLICRYTPEGTLTFANPAFLQFFSMFDPPESAGLSIQSLLSGSIAGAGTLLPVLSASSTRRTSEIALSRDKQETLWFMRSSVGVFDDQGQLVEIQDLFHDMTERRIAQQRLQESEFRYRALFENDWDGIIIMDGASEIILDVNPSLCALIGFGREHLVGNRFGVVEPVSALHHLISRPATRREKRDVREAHAVPLVKAGGIAIFVDVVVASSVSEGRLLTQWNLRDVTDRRRSDDRLRTLSARLLTLQDDERRRIARELHDSTGQNLSALQMTLTLLEASIPEAVEDVPRLIGECRSLLDQSCTEIRTMSYLLHPPLLDEMGLVFATKWFVDGFSRRTGLTVETALDESISRAPIPIETALYRIVQESFNNIHRHSSCRHSWVRLYRNNNSIVLEIEDDGSGIDPDRLAAFDASVPSLGVGLLGMRERVKQLQGTFEIQSGSTGTIIRVKLPLVSLDV